MQMDCSAHLRFTGYLTSLEIKRESHVSIFIFVLIFVLIYSFILFLHSVLSLGLY